MAEIDNFSFDSGSDSDSESDLGDVEVIRIYKAKSHDDIVNIRTYDNATYASNIETYKETLFNYGVTIINSVLDETEADNIVDGMWEYFEHATSEWDINEQVERTDDTTWKNIYKMNPLHGMLFHHGQDGQAQVCWDVRQNEKIVNIFADYWETEPDLLAVSMDGFSFHLPSIITKKGYRMKNFKFHIDQSYAEIGFKCLQGFVTGTDAIEGSSTLSIIEKSHLYQKEFAERFPEAVDPKNQWHVLTLEQIQFYLNKGCKVKSIMCPKGSLVLWDSRTVHCISGNVNKSKSVETRAVVYVSYRPSVILKKGDVNKRLKCLKELRTTSHDVVNVKMFPKKPPTFGHGPEPPDTTPIEPPILSELGKILASEIPVKQPTNTQRKRKPAINEEKKITTKPKQKVRMITKDKLMEIVEQCTTEEKVYDDVEEMVNVTELMKQLDMVEIKKRMNIDKLIEEVGLDELINEMTESTDKMEV